MGFFKSIFLQSMPVMLPATVYAPAIDVRHDLLFPRLPTRPHVHHPPACVAKLCAESSPVEVSPKPNILTELCQAL